MKNILDLAKTVAIGLWHNLVPSYIRKRKHYYVNLKGPQHKRRLQKLVHNASEKSPINVLFVAGNIAMWRAQDVYELFKADKRFNPYVIVVIPATYNRNEAEKQAAATKEYLMQKGTNVVSVLDNGFNLEKWFADFNPDIIFVYQQYSGILNNLLDVDRNYNRLLVQIPYGIPTLKSEMVYNTEFHNMAWRVYHASSIHLKTAKKLMANNAENVRIVGDPDFDKIQKSNNNPWKIIKDGKSRKKIIWAPHFSFFEGSFLVRSSFGWLYNEMINIAKKYSDSIQIAFKPHPHLYNQLLKHPDWGEERAREYYSIWESMENTQYVSGNFTDLFKFSDAMVHDCGSFTGEYMMVNKPVMFTTKDIDSVKSDADDFGLKCLSLHYVGSSIEDIEYFIENIVSDESKDSLRGERERFYKDCLLPPMGQSAAKNIYDDIISSLEFNRN